MQILRCSNRGWQLLTEREGYKSHYFIFIFIIAQIQIIRLLAKFDLKKLLHTHVEDVFPKKKIYFFLIVFSALWRVSWIYFVKIFINKNIQKMWNFFFQKFINFDGHLFRKCQGQLSKVNCHFVEKLYIFWFVTGTSLLKWKTKSCCTAVAKKISWKHNRTWLSQSAWQLEKNEVKINAELQTLKQIVFKLFLRP